MLMDRNLAQDNASAGCAGSYETKNLPDFPIELKFNARELARDAKEAFDHASPIKQLLMVAAALNLAFCGVCVGIKLLYVSFWAAAIVASVILCALLVVLASGVFAAMVGLMIAACYLMIVASIWVLRMFLRLMSKAIKLCFCTLAFFLCVLICFQCLTSAATASEHLLSGLPIVHTKQPSFYQILDVPPTASSKEINKAFKTAVIRTHPDKNRLSSTTMEDYLQVQTAHEALTHHASRCTYDLMSIFLLQDPAGLVTPVGWGRRAIQCAPIIVDIVTAIKTGEAPEWFVEWEAFDYDATVQDVSMAEVAVQLYVSGSLQPYAESTIHTLIHIVEVSCHAASQGVEIAVAWTDGTLFQACMSEFAREYHALWNLCWKMYGDRL